MAFEDRLLGPVSGVVDDFVVRRNDGAPAYNLAVVVDDAAQGIGEVVRGSDLVDSTPRQLWLARALGLAEPAHAHVPLVLGPDGARLAKRHGDVTLREVPPDDALAWMAGSLGMRGRTATELLAEFDPAALPRRRHVRMASPLGRSELLLDAGDLVGGGLVGLLRGLEAALGLLGLLAGGLEAALPLAALCLLALVGGLALAALRRLVLPLLVALGRLRRSLLGVLLARRRLARDGGELAGRPAAGLAAP